MILCEIPHYSYVICLKKYTNNDMIAELQKQAAQMGKMQLTFCKTANSLLGTLNQNEQQSQEQQHKPKKHRQQCKRMDSSDVWLVNNGYKFD